MSHSVTQAQRLTVYMTESARHEGRPLFEWLIQQAVKLQVGGATVAKAIAGYGRHGRIHHTHLVELSDDLPVVFECVDAPDKIGDFMLKCQPALAGQSYILEDVKLHRPQS